MSDVYKCFPMYIEEIFRLTKEPCRTNEFPAELSSAMQRYKNPNEAATYGGKQKTRKAASAWVSAGRKVTLANGTTRTLYKNASKPGQQLRIRKMVTRNGSKVATYVAPPKAAKKR